MTKRSRTFRHSSYPSDGLGRPSYKRHFPAIAGFLLALCVAASANAADWKFTLRYKKSLHEKPYSGRVYVFFSRFNSEPRNGPDWFQPEMFIAKDVRDWKGGTPLALSSDDAKNVLSFPKPLAKLDLAGCRAQAVARFNPFHRLVGRGPGNGYSQVVTVSAKSPTPVLVIDRLVAPRKFVETKWVKLLRVKSKLLSRFYGRDVFLNASVRLPASYYDQPKRRYPAIFEIPGFGGTHFVRGGGAPVRERNKGGVEFFRVVPDPSCPRGHHVFADSANNGPVGKALITELIPAFNRQFRSIPDAKARFLTGHSSGGWSSLWLQVTYPDQFGGTWSTSPDPVDFRDFQQINLYKPGENMYVDAKGNRRPIARLGGRVALWYDDFSKMERVLGYGGQLHSFEAVFSPRGKDGEPLLLWDRETGRIDAKVARTWEKYDIRLVLERNWKTLGPRLKGKLHVHTGTADTFYLEGAARLLRDSQKTLHSDAVVELHRGRTHFDLFRGGLGSRIRGEMVDQFLAAFPGEARQQ
jgi:Putative esterase